MEKDLKDWIAEEGFDEFETSVRALLEDHEAINVEECITSIMRLLQGEMGGAIEDDAHIAADEDIDMPDEDFGRDRYFDNDA